MFIKLNVYADKNSYPQDQRYHLNDISKALWNDRTPEERDRVYGEWVRGYESVSRIEEADIVLLTMKWNYYVDRNLVHLALKEIENAAQVQKKVVAFSGGDHPANLVHPQVMLFESGGYRSAGRVAYHSGLPSFIKDYLQLYCAGEMQTRHKSPRAVVGFCGQAGASAPRLLFRHLRIRFENLEHRNGRRSWQPAPFETSAFRQNVLQQFSDKPGIQTNFLLRKKYHAGDGSDKSDFSPQKIDFVHNILDSDYTVCMRGGGNFSVRFYETLALGRIPIFIDSDCLLPFEDRIPYRELFPWIEMRDLPRAAEMVADFHSRLSDQDFIDLQVKCRKLWQEHFTPNGFHHDLHETVQIIT